VVDAGLVVASGRMAQTSSIILNADDRERLAVIVADRNRRHKHVQRARRRAPAGAGRSLELDEQAWAPGRVAMAASLRRTA
jgi:hypothetical protein